MDWKDLKCPICNSELDVFIYRPNGTVTLQCKKCRDEFAEEQQKKPKLAWEPVVSVMKNVRP